MLKLIIFMNSDGSIIYNFKRVQLLAPLIIGVIGDSGITSKPINNTRLENTINMYNV